jgi:hypothetical protein
MVVDSSVNDISRRTRSPNAGLDVRIKDHLAKSARQYPDNRTQK